MIHPKKFYFSVARPTPNSSMMSNRPLPRRPAEAYQQVGDKRPGGQRPGGQRPDEAYQRLLHNQVCM